MNVISLPLVLGTLFVTFFCIYLGCLLWRKRQTDRSFEIKKQPLLAGAVYLGTLMPVAVVVFGGWLLPLSVYAFFVFTGLILLYSLVRWNNIKYWLLGLPILCCFGTMILTGLIPSSSVAWYEYVLYALFWSLFVGIFVVFDRIPCCSYLQGIIWGGSALLALMVLSNIPLFFSIVGSVLFVVILGLSKVMVKWQVPNLGPYAAVLVGFLWGALFTVALMYHQFLPVILMLNSYIFALTFGLVLMWKFIRKSKGKGADFGQAISSEALASIFGYILKYCGLLSCIGILLWSATIAYPEIATASVWTGVGVVILIFFLNLYNCIRDGGAPAPRIRDLISNAVQGVKVGIVAAKKEVAEMGMLYQAKKDAVRNKTVTTSQPQKPALKKGSKKRKK
ncbi:MAG: hypothetical protein J6Y85_02780 [Alphaproteobacteria bacterium]|nr:hypothetical protein [Alphaproteobacteria bacterium]